MGILPGYWRTNELSTIVLPCFPRTTCIGSSSVRTPDAETLCLLGHRGPYCTSCMDHHFKGVDRLCQPCTTSAAQLLLKLFPLVVVAALAAALVAVSLARQFVRRNPKALRAWLARLEARGTRGLQAIFGPISPRAVGIIVIPKLKVVVSMLQVRPLPPPPAPHSISHSSRWRCRPS